MKYAWHDYDPGVMGYVETWLDASAVRSTGLEEGFRSFYEYWAGEEGFVLGENFWCKVISDSEGPFAVVALCLYEGSVNVMEILVAPEKRGRGYGADLLRELLHHEQILGFPVHKSEALIFLSNAPSQKAFEKAGFQYQRTHEDGDAVYYCYQSR